MSFMDHIHSARHALYAADFSHPAYQAAGFGSLLLALAPFWQMIALVPPTAYYIVLILQQPSVRAWYRARRLKKARGG